MKYYLYKKGTLAGPFDTTQIESMKKSSKLQEYHWMIDSESQIWKSVCEAPRENPFLKNSVSPQTRTITGAFFHGKSTVIGEVVEMNSFGMVLKIQNQKTQLNSLAQNQTYQVNLCDETDLMFVNAKASVQQQSLTQEGLMIRFHWEGMEVFL